MFNGVNLGNLCSGCDARDRRIPVDMPSRHASLPDEQTSDELSIRARVLKDCYTFAGDAARKSDRGLVKSVPRLKASHRIGCLHMSCAICQLSERGRFNYAPDEYIAVINTGGAPHVRFRSFAAALPVALAWGVTPLDSSCSMIGIRATIPKGPVTLDLIKTVVRPVYDHHAGYKEVRCL